MENFVGISVMMTVGDDVNGQGSNCKISVISKGDNCTQPFVLTPPKEYQHASAIRSGEKQSGLLFLNGINDDENHKTDDELDDINTKSELTWKNRNKETDLFPVDLEEKSSEILPADSASVYPTATANSEEVKVASTNFSGELLSPPCFGSGRSTESCCASSCSNETFGSCQYSEGSADTCDSYNLATKSRKPVKHEAEHMLWAVREIKTPWAKELENRLAEEIKLDNQNKTEMKVIRKNKTKSREHENLMKAMKEIGTGWAQDIERANYLKCRNREKVNYNLSLRPEAVNHKVSDCLVTIKKLPVSSLTHGGSLNIKTNGKKRSTAQMLLKKAVKEKREMSASNNKVQLQLRKTVGDGKPKLKAKVKPVKIEKVKRVVLPHSSRNKTQVPMLNNSQNGGMPSVILKRHISNNQLLKKVKVNHFSETSLKNIGKVKACISDGVVPPTTKQRQSARQQDQSSAFKEIGVKKHLNFIQIILLNKQNAAFLGIQVSFTVLNGEKITPCGILEVLMFLNVHLLAPCYILQSRFMRVLIFII